MLRTIRGSVAGLNTNGVSLSEVVAAKPTVRFDSQYGK